MRASTSSGDGHRSTDCFNDRTGIGERVEALQTTEVVGGCPFGQAVRAPGRDVKPVKNPHSVFEVCHLISQRVPDRVGKFTPGATQAMAPDLLPVVQMKGFEGFLNSLMTSETGPVVVVGIGT